MFYVLCSVFDVQYFTTDYTDFHREKVPEVPKVGSTRSPFLRIGHGAAVGIQDIPDFPDKKRAHQDLTGSFSLKRG